MLDQPKSRFGREVGRAPSGGVKKKLFSAMGRSECRKEIESSQSEVKMSVMAETRNAMHGMPIMPCVD
jgi:hypothetical protein